MLRSKGRCVIVVAEGCGETMLKSCGEDGEVDGGTLSICVARHAFVVELVNTA